jgi:P pilus assembly chaperone PapD
VEELPPADAGESQSSVHVLTKMGVPIFFTPAKVRAEAELGDLHAHGAAVSFAIRNPGNVHFMVQSVRLRGLSATSETIFDSSLDGWYVLAEGLRAYKIEIPSTKCESTRSLEVSVQVGTALLKDRLDLPADACSP